MSCKVSCEYRTSQTSFLVTVVDIELQMLSNAFGACVTKEDPSGEHGLCHIMKVYGSIGIDIEVEGLRMD